VCAACGAIHYRNPKVVVGCLATLGTEVLLCRRAIEPRRDLWTLPAGFMENGETLEQGAARETLEEANARVEMGGLYTVISLPHISQVYVMFLARLADRGFGPGPESLEVRLFREEEAAPVLPRPARRGLPASRVGARAARARDPRSRRRGLSPVARARGASRHGQGWPRGRACGRSLRSRNLR